MGLPIERLVVATNENDILDRFFRTGTYSRVEVTPTITPSMDICVSSNFERFLYHMLEDDSDKTQQLMSEFEKTKTFTLPEEAFARYVIAL
jgi:threonine synthase